MINLIGKTLGRLTILKKTRKENCGSHYFYLCVCSCGKKKEILGNSIIMGKTRSCGCLNREESRKRSTMRGKRYEQKAIGRKFGRLAILERTDQDNSGHYSYMCLCKCGKRVEARMTDLVTGKTQSCGCLHSDYARERCLSFNKLPQSSKSRQKRREWNVNNPNRKFKETSIEIKVETELKRRGVVYKKQVPLCKTAIVDFYLPEYRIVIQCDGCYWHGCKKCDKKGAIDRHKKDQKQDLVLISGGFVIYRFWEHDINEDPGACIDRIRLN